MGPRAIIRRPFPWPTLTKIRPAVAYPIANSQNSSLNTVTCKSAPYDHGSRTDEHYLPRRQPQERRAR